VANNGFAFEKAKSTLKIYPRGGVEVTINRVVRSIKILWWWIFTFKRKEFALGPSKGFTSNDKK